MRVASTIVAALLGCCLPAHASTGFTCEAADPSAKFSLGGDGKPREASGRVTCSVSD